MTTRLTESGAGADRGGRVNRRRDIVVLLGTLALAPRTVLAQLKPAPGKVWRVGFLTGGSNHLLSEDESSAGFLRGMRELGYVEKKNYSIEWRYADGKPERFPALAADLVRLQVDIIVTNGTNATIAAKKATNIIPIVMAAASDAVGTGLVTSLARPGANVTGLTNITSELSGKRLELLKELVPGISVIAVLLNPEEPGSKSALVEMEGASQALGIQLAPVMVRARGDFEKAISAVIARRVDAFVIIREQSRIPSKNGSSNSPRRTECP